VGERAARLEASYFPAAASTQITSALTDGEVGAENVLKNDEIGFHLADWQRDAAFIVALILFPERFTNEDIRDEIDSFLCHVPAHILEAARLGGYPVENIFNKEGEPLQ
jgi:hypothetical protein